MADSIPKRVRDAVDARADGYCEACGGPFSAGSMTESRAHHHRLPRSRGGLHTVANLMAVHHACHNVAPGSIHQNPARSKRLKHTLLEHEDPEAFPPITVPGLRALRQ